MRSLFTVLSSVSTTEITSLSICCKVEIRYLEAVFKLLADKVKDNGVYAGVDCCKVDAEVIHDQQETENRK